METQLILKTGLVCFEIILFAHLECYKYTISILQRIGSVVCLNCVQIRLGFRVHTIQSVLSQACRKSILKGCAPAFKIFNLMCRISFNDSMLRRLFHLVLRKEL